MGTGALFVVSDNGQPQEKTIYLRDALGDGVGTASVGVVATQPGVVTVALKADRVRTSHELTFEPVRLAMGAPVPSRLQPGQVIHEVCVATNSAHGTLRVDTLEVPGSEGQTTPGSFSPTNREVRSDMPANAGCPTEAVDAFGWQGYALFTWGTPVEFAQATMSYLGPNDEALTSDILALRGEPFAGYQVVSTPPEASESWTSIAVTLTYPNTGPLSGGPASGVKLQDIRFIPESGPTFLGSSSGGAEVDPVTDLDGGAVLFFDTADLVGTFALFVTPENGATEYLADIELL